MKSRLIFLVVAFFVFHFGQAHSAVAECNPGVSGVTSDGAYDFSTALFADNFALIEHDWPRIHAYGVPVRKHADGTEEILAANTRVGRVLVISPRYILTAFHVADVQTYILHQITPFGTVEIEDKADRVEAESYSLELSAGAPLVPLKKIVDLPHIDAALFEFMRDDTVLSASLPLGRSDELCLGHVVFILGSPGIFGTGIHVREGIVSALHFIAPEMLRMPSGKAPVIDMNMLISISAPLDRGDSGSAVVALRDGKPEAIGFSSNIFATPGLMHGINMVVPIDEVVRQIKRATGIDLKQLSDDYFHK